MTAGRGFRVNWEILSVVILLTLMVVQMVLIARLKSATMDEQNHITRGVTYLRTGDLRLGHAHPPLINLIGALPLLPDRNLVLPLDDPSWHTSNLDLFAREFLWKVNPNSHSIVFRARLPIIALTLLLGVIVYAWGRELYGRSAGLLGLTLLAFDPNVLAHGSLATNDMGLACFVTLSAYTFWRWLRWPTWSRAVVATLALGLAQASKFSAIFLIPALSVTALIHWLLMPAEKRRPRTALHLLGWLALIGVAAALTLWAVYGFKLGPLSDQELTVPASAYFNELQKIIEQIRTGHPTFLLGSYSTTGWWYYFPVAFAVKTPLPTVLLVVASLIYAWRRRAWQQGLPLLIPVAIYFGFSMIGSFNIGYRHLLPAVAILLIFTGQLGQIRWQIKSKPAWAGAVLLIWLVIGTWSTFPHYLAYFNEIAGGPDGGYRVLVDSNLDWGQDLIGLKDYMNREGIESVKLSYFGSAYPEAYGIAYEPLPGYPRHTWPYNSTPQVLSSPVPGVYAISVTNLQGALFPKHDLYAWFRARKPDAIIGHSIYIYRLK